MDVWEAMRTRRSIREFSSIPLSFDVLVRILEAAHQAPCAGGLQSWRFILVTERATLKSLKPICMDQECFDTASAAIVICSLPEKVGEWYGDRGRDLYSVQDCAAATQNMLLAAHASGIGAVWIGAFDERGIREKLGIPDSSRPLAIVCLGNALSKPEPKSTVPLSGVVYFNKYGSTIKNMNLVLRDYSLEIQARTQPMSAAAKKEASGLAHKVKKSLSKAKNKAFPRK